MHCNNTRQLPEPSGFATPPTQTTDNVLLRSCLSCKVVRPSVPDAATAAQAFIFLINFNARKNFRLAPCAIYMPHLCDVGVAPGTALRRTQRGLFLANNQIAQTASETETESKRKREKGK